MNDIQVAKESLDKIIKKARVHLYKPIPVSYTHL
ncbi:HaeII family restriction endonuclease, partial [Haemophilus influenzae]